MAQRTAAAWIEQFHRERGRRADAADGADRAASHAAAFRQIGFAIGEDRLVMSLGKTAEEVSRKPDVYIAPLGAGMNKEAIRLARELRRHNIVTELGDETFRLKKSLETGSKLGAKYALIVGENEVSTGVFALKNLATGEQKSVARNELAGAIRASQ